MCWVDGPYELYDRAAFLGPARLLRHHTPDGATNEGLNPAVLHRVLQMMRRE